MSTPRPQCKCHCTNCCTSTLPHCGIEPCNAEGVAAPLEPTQIAARKFRIDRSINDGTMMSGTWIDAIMAEFAAAVSKNCICHGNWRQIVKKSEHLIGEQFVDESGNEYIFFGIVHGKDDYYYGMRNKDNTRLLSCVGSIEGWNFKLAGNSPR